MPSWKKVITSGSNAQLNQITASGFNLVGTGTAELEVDGHITASGNISSSGIINANEYFVDGEGLANKQGTLIGIADDATWDDIQIGKANNLNQRIKLTGPTNVTGHITASGNISSSGTIEANGNISTNAIINAPEGVFTDNIEINKTAIPKLQLKDGTNDRKLVIQVANTVTDFINNDNAAHDLRFKLHGEDNHLFLEAQNNRVGIGDNAPNQKLGIKGTNAQISIEESDTEFLRLGVGETENDAIIGYHDDNFLRFGVYSSPTDTSIDTHMSIGPTGHITASGNISGSGLVIGETIRGGTIRVSDDGGTGVSAITKNGTETRFGFHSSQTIRIGKTLSTPVTIPSNITASGNISSSGNLHADATTQTNLDKLVTYDTSTGQFHITASSAFMGSGGGGGAVDSIVAGDGIDVSSATGDVTITAEDASTTNPGVVELATTAETTTGTDTARAVTPDSLKDGYQGSTNVTTLGTITTGTWNGTAIASANLDSDTAHLTTDQTFSGKKTFSAAITASGNISSSGVLSGTKIRINGTTAIDDASADSTPLFRIGAFGGFNDYRGSTNFNGPVTASQSISASGHIATDSDLKGMSEASQLLIGHQTPNASYVKAQISEHADANAPVAMDFLKSRGTLASPTAVTQGDFTGTQRYFGYDGNSYDISAAIRGDIDASVSNGQVPGMLNFLTAPAGSLISRMVIASTGNVGIGAFTATSLPPKTLTVTGDISGSGELIIGNIESNTYISASNGTLEISGSGRGQLEVDYRLFNTGSTHLSAAGGAQGDIVKFGGTSTTAGKIYMYNTDHTWVETQANTVSRSTGSLAVALGSNSTTDGMLLRGYTKLANDVSTGAGQPIFLSNNGIGQATGSAPAGSGNVVRVIGYYFGNSGQVYFNPDNTTIVVA